ncbi:MAG: bifunctional [glutamine synthetase] adenylyltransferase/[glutamine synthetase]-adenylyl-L-tyrosine phosphorylase [Alphaproteobacteria bacterium]|nr:bifunctional [glutamine synthetase] adenylyltransferase/[glutamine synthetase]-adenylyl-L-tyrosine phosphorylase [Alphaproteobacteria bacterium]
MLNPSINFNHLPLPSDDSQAKLGMEKWRNLVTSQSDHLKQFIIDLTNNLQGQKILQSIFGNSPYLTYCLLNEPDTFYSLCTEKSIIVYDKILKELEQILSNISDINLFMHHLRIAKRRISLVIALSDLAQWWYFKEIVRKLSHFADTILNLTCHYLLNQARLKGDLIFHDHDILKKCGFVILGMGKLGGKELNYSSDIDLIMLYDPNKIIYKGKQSLQNFFTTFTRQFIHILQYPTVDGYVFRVDLRLRPDPVSTPLCISIQAAENYYETFGQNWERLALIRARTIAGDFEIGQNFLKTIQPFIWRKYLDFAALQDIHRMKEQIHINHGHNKIKLEGHNIKIGAGGIREIEFFIQTQQLIWGGRYKDLQTSSLEDALDQLVHIGCVDKKTSELMKEAYIYLRTLEHRLQMIDDHQIHELPSQPEKLKQLSCFIKEKSIKDFEAKTYYYLNNVAKNYIKLFNPTSETNSNHSLIFTGIDYDSETIKFLEKLGFTNPLSVIDIIRRWYTGQYRSTQNEKVKNLLYILVPKLLKIFGQSTNPELALIRFDKFISSLPTGIQIFSLLHNYPNIFSTISDIMIYTPFLVELLNEKPQLAEFIITPFFYDPLPPLPKLKKELHTQIIFENNYEENLNICRRWLKEKKFQLAFKFFKKQIDIETLTYYLSNIANIIIQIVFDITYQAFTHQYGSLPNYKIAVIALGKLGANGLSFSSDLDLIFLYNPEKENNEIIGKKISSLNDYSARLTQRFIHAISLISKEGKLYDIDMRLRPSGNVGPIASSLSAFTRYYQEQAWTWEYMALTKARVICDFNNFKPTVNKTIRNILCQKRSNLKILRDVLEMRERLFKNHPTQNIWEIKYVKGGIIDIEFICQYLQLIYGFRYPSILHSHTIAALKALNKYKILSTNHTEILLNAFQFYQKILVTFEILGLNGHEKDFSLVNQKTMSYMIGKENFDILKMSLLDTSEQVQSLYQTILKPIEI